MSVNREDYIRLSNFDTLCKWLTNLDTNVDYVFVRAARNGKNPVTSGAIIDKETGFINTGIDGISRSFDESRKWVEKGYNVGIYAYCEPPKTKSLVFFDFDIKKGKPEGDKGELTADYDSVVDWAKSENTFIQKTRSGGLQVFFVNDGSIDNFNMFVEGIHAGECRAYNQYVLVCGSYVPPYSDDDKRKGKVPLEDADGYYTPINVGLPVEVGIEDIPEWLDVQSEEEQKKQKQRLSNIEIPDIPSGRTKTSSGFKNEFGMSLDDVIQRSKTLQRYLNAPLIPGFRSEEDMAVANSLFYWRFDPLTIADILQTYRQYEKTERTDYLQRTIASAITEISVQYTPRRLKREFLENIGLTEIETVKTETIPSPRHLLDQKHTYTIISGPPRGGKTHNNMMVATTGNQSVNYVTNRHSIIEQAHRVAGTILSDRWKGNKDFRNRKRVVWLSGKSKSCPFGKNDKGQFDCKNCHLYPGEDYTTLMSYQQEAADIIYKNPVLSSKLVEKKSDMCPYYLTKYAEKLSDVCLTVPYYLTTTDKSQRIQDRDILIIDEDSTISSFYPGSVELASYTRKNGAFDNMLSKHMKFIEYVEGRVKVTEDGSEKKVLQKWDKVILEVIGKIKSINAVLDHFATSERGKDGFTIEDLQKAIELINIDIDIPDITLTDELKSKTIKKVEDYEHDIPQIDDGSSVGNIFEAMLYRFEEKPLCWIGKINKKLYLVGDERKLIKVPSGKQIITVGFTLAEMFIDDMKEYLPGDSIKYDVTNFKYGKNFVVVRVTGETKSDQKRLMYKFIRHCHRKNNEGMAGHLVPSLVLTSSEVKQRKFIDRFRHNVHAIREENIDAIYRMYTTGGFMPFYANSKISRGIDADRFDVMFVDSTDFAQPYYDAAIIAANERGEGEKALELVKIKQTLLMDEVTNSVLRISNVQGGDTDQAKFIIVTADDYDLIQPKVTEDMFVFDLTAVEYFDAVWTSIYQCVKKVGRECKFDRDQLVFTGVFEPGLGWEDAKGVFDQLSIRPKESLTSIREAHRQKNLNEKLRSDIKSWLESEPNKRFSTEAIKKRIKRSQKHKDISDWAIERVLRDMAGESVIRSLYDHTKNKKFYWLQRP